MNNSGSVLLALRDFTDFHSGSLVHERAINSVICGVLFFTTFRLESVERYDPRIGMWELVCSMEIGRYLPGVAVTNRIL